MVLAIALTLWAFAALPIALVLGRLCRASSQSENPRDRLVDLPDKILTN